MIKNNTLFKIPGVWSKTLQNETIIIDYAGDNFPEDAEAYTEDINGTHYIYLSSLAGADEITINHELIHIYDKAYNLSKNIDFHEFFQCPIAELPNYEVLAYALEEFPAEKTIKILTNL